MSKTSNPYSAEAGFITASTNPKTGEYVVLYDGPLAGFDVSEGRWVVLCTRHGSFIHETNQRRARKLMKCPEEWCSDCGEIEDAPDLPQPVPFQVKTPDQQERELRLMARMVKGNPEKAAIFEKVYGVRPEHYW